MDDKPIAVLPIDYLQPNPLQPRGVITPESLSELVDSIKTHGIIQPLVVAHTPAGYQIIAGERRWRASKLCGLKEVPVRIIETSPQGMLEMAIVENVQRTDLNPIDRANSFERLIKEFNLGNSDISQRIGKSPAFVSNTLRLLELPDALKDGLISGVISEGHARALAAIPDTQSMIEAYKIILREGGSVRRAEELSRRFKKTMNRTKPGDGYNTKTVNEFIDKMAEEIQGSIGENAHVKMRRSRLETAIHIVLKGNPEETEKQIQKIHDSLVIPGATPIIAKSDSDEAISDTQESVENTYSNPFEPFSDAFAPVTADPATETPREY
ncbi:MAG: Chromosome partitioning protein ParB [Candidatus Collierbacteria bacterium GW2011_GWB1_44_6]|uniref:Chromosome partitioning protein ParB n=2 Tax=Candidatus Collieribacteriota TaxID=1752725 RepID=A0A0G1JQM3_9BACT|nr:MAG: Chromosome partitioning protein ParB [Candidatus Collierbacteria bacterium GW2011_GWC2_43_12]KKT73831.1 MAG: Chromosome partitioning protein ParB [Candidatus Collierbacteria bacterium GW2011_GWB1_44_6]KKT84050.1 MAG: Chromosome partitioning protein ParB [Microgenomates group bacterium GW2011_GWC1_44_9]